MLCVVWMACNSWWQCTTCKSRAVSQAGLIISGINAEVMPGQVRCARFVRMLTKRVAQAKYASSLAALLP